jgi:A/G-specific adenine glycosylase
VALNRRAVLVEQRPAAGIWGGLLSVPQFARKSELARAARALGGGRPRALPGRRHGFTHFTLDYTPYVVGLAARPKHPAPGQRWLPLARIDGAALPAPILALLREVRDAGAAA